MTTSYIPQEEKKKKKSPAGQALLTINALPVDCPTPNLANQDKDRIQTIRPRKTMVVAPHLSKDLRVNSGFGTPNLVRLGLVPRRVT